MAKAAFSSTAGKAVLQGPPAAGMVVIAARVRHDRRDGRDGRGLDQGTGWQGPAADGARFLPGATGTASER